MANPVRFAHLYHDPDHLRIFTLPGTDDPEVVQIPGRPGISRAGVEVTSLVQAADILIAAAGWKLGPDGWRRPLDPTAPMVATAHLVRLDAPR